MLPKEEKQGHDKSNCIVIIIVLNLVKQLVWAVIVMLSSPLLCFSHCTLMDVHVAVYHIIIIKLCFSVTGSQQKLFDLNIQDTVSLATEH